MTTITISDETKAKLQSFGAKGETFDKIVSRIIDSLADLRTRSDYTGDEGGN